MNNNSSSCSICHFLFKFTLTHSHCSKSIHPQHEQRSNLNKVMVGFPHPASSKSLMAALIPAVPTRMWHCFPFIILLGRNSFGGFLVCSPTIITHPTRLRTKCSSSASFNYNYISGNYVYKHGYLYRHANTVQDEIVSSASFICRCVFKHPLFWDTSSSL